MDRLTLSVHSMKLKDKTESLRGIFNENKIDEIIYKK